ncbi:MAG: hypothetical protein IKT68_01720, partial [Clostridia bacterium]|nr:hypothetical protein [Clostridia bacterium]
MYKKSLAYLLALIMLVSTLPTTFASSEPPAEKAFLPALRMSFCDSPLRFVNGAYPSMSVEADGKNYTEAPASLKVSGTGSSMVVYTRAMTPVDITPYTYLEFDFYTTTLDVLSAGAGQLELSSSGSCDIAEAAAGPKALFNQVTKEGWNHIQIPLTAFGKNSNDPTRVFDPTAVNFFRFYLVNLNGKYTYNIDNMYFSNGEGVAPNDTPTATEFVTAAPLKNNGYTYGDINGDTKVGSDDALTALKYVVGKTDLQNKQLAMADVNDDADVTATDALDILKRVVGNISDFAVETKETLPATVEVGINESHLVHTQYPTDSRVVAETDVIYWGAKGDGVTDDTIAFQKALDYTAAKEGGTVFVPSGTFAIRGNLTIPNGVTLQGDAPKVTADGPVEGTLLLAYAGRGQVDGKPFITMDSASALANCSIYYPEQTMGDITPYPWTIRQGGHYGIALSNVRLVNPYQGIGMFYTNSLQNIRGVVGTPLKTGLILDGNVDICRVENVNFTSDCWLNSGLCDTADSEVLKHYLYHNATAFKFEHVDWTYVTDIAAKGYYVALGNSKPTTREAESSPNGHVFNVNFEDCYIGYHAQYVNPIGMLITQGKIEAQFPVLAEADFVTSFSLNHLDLITTGDTCITNRGAGIIMVENCTLQANGGKGIFMANGQLTATLVDFKDCQSHVICEKPATATVTNCMTTDTLVWSGDVSPVWNETLQVADYSEVKNYDYNQEAVTFTAGDAFADITKEPYCADTTNTYDIGILLQQALNDVATAGGGVVYIPSGRYRLDSAVTVPAGVELKGSCTFPQHSHAYSTTFYTTYGLGEDDTFQALITLQPTAGMNGFKVYYDQQPGGANDCEMYAFTARGTGLNNYILNVNFINSFYQTDLASNRCDGHYVNGVTGYPLEQGIVVGGGSKHGIVRDCQFNIHYFGDNPIYKTMNVDGDSSRQYGTDHSEAFVVKNTTHQIMYHNFVLGVHSGIAIDEGADVFVLAHGTDGGDRSMTVRGTPSGKITMVNTQLVVIGPGKTKAYINVEESFTGRVDMTQTNMWGQPSRCSILVGGGTLALSGGTNVRSGNNGVQVWNNANFFMDTVYHMRGDLNYDLHLDDANQVVTFGNIY